jgi:hypothetical protein
MNFNKFEAGEMKKKFVLLLLAAFIFTVVLTVGCRKTSPSSPSETKSNPTFTATRTAVVSSPTVTSTATVTPTVTMTSTTKVTSTATATSTETPEDTPTSTPTNTPCDLSFGNSGSPDVGINQNDAVFEEYNSPNPALLTGIRIYSLNGGNNVVVAIYDGSGNIVTQSASTACSSGWNTISVPNTELSAGNYYIGAVADQLFGIMASNGGSAPVYASFTYGSPFPATIGDLHAGSGGGFELAVVAVCTCP